MIDSVKSGRQIQQNEDWGILLYYTFIFTVFAETLKIFAQRLIFTNSSFA